MRKEKAIYYADFINKHTDFRARADIDYLSQSWFVQVMGGKYYTSNSIEQSVVYVTALNRCKEIPTHEKVYAVYINGDNDGEFPTKHDAELYIRGYIRGTAETYKKSQKWVREHTDITIEEIEYD